MIIQATLIKLCEIWLMADIVCDVCYSCGILSCLWTIYREEGLKGLFAGLIPRFIGEISCLIISSVVTYTFHQYIIQDKELRTFTRSSVQVCKLTDYDKRIKNIG